MKVKQNANLTNKGTLLINNGKLEVKSNILDQQIDPKSESNELMNVAAKAEALVGTSDQNGFSIDGVKGELDNVSAFANTENNATITGEGENLITVKGNVTLLADSYTTVVAASKVPNAVSILQLKGVFAKSETGDIVKARLNKANIKTDGMVSVNAKGNTVS